MITVSSLTKQYGQRIAVDDLSFDVAAGRVTGFVGPNGAGKSTTMRMMVGLTRPDRGGTTYRGVSYSDMLHPARVVGTVLDARSMHPGRTARNHLAAAAALASIPTRRVEAVLNEVGLDSAADQRTGGFSLGMRQRLALAGALLGEPEVLLLDEPSNGLDPDGIRWLRNYKTPDATDVEHPAGTYAFTEDVPIDAAFYERLRAGIGDQLPKGLITHLVVERPEGGLRYIDVWESKQDWDRFEQERVHPVVHQMLSQIFGEHLPAEPERIPMSVVHAWHP